MNHEVVQVGVQFVQKCSHLRIAVLTYKHEVLLLLLRNLKEELSQISHHVVVDVLQGKHLSDSRNSLRRNLLARLLQLLTSYVKLFQDLMNEQCEVLHEHLILLEHLGLDQTEYLSERRGRHVLNPSCSLRLAALRVNNHGFALDIGHHLVGTCVNERLFALQRLELLAENLVTLGIVLPRDETLEDILH